MPDHRRRMYITNMMDKIAKNMVSESFQNNSLFKVDQSSNDNLHEVHTQLGVEDGGAAQKLKDTFDQLNQSKCKMIILISYLSNVIKGCSNFVMMLKIPGNGVSMPGKTKLDKEKSTQSQTELVSHFCKLV